MLGETPLQVSGCINLPKVLDLISGTFFTLDTNVLILYNQGVFMNQLSNNPLNTYVLYTGGAYGADALFGVLAHKYGVGKQFHIRPVGNERIHKSLSKLGLQPLVAQSEHLFKAVDKIDELLGIKLKLGTGANLLARNYYQVSNSESVLAVAYLTGEWVPRAEFVGHDKANRLIPMMEQVFIKATKIVELKVYRLEDSETGKGPFSSPASGPFSWSESHRAPMESDSPTYEEYAKWIEKVEPTGWGLPSHYRFAFSTLERLKDCFEGYEKYPNFKIMEYIIDTSDPLSFISLSDGQVIFCEVISKREL